MWQIDGDKSKHPRRYYTKLEAARAIVLARELAGKARGVQLVLLAWERRP
jgi:hypothetical protein